MRLFLHIEHVRLPDSRPISSTSSVKLLLSPLRRCQDLHHQPQRPRQPRKLSKESTSFQTSKRSSAKSKLHQTSSYIKRHLALRGLMVDGTCLWWNGKAEDGEDDEEREGGGAEEMLFFKFVFSIIIVHNSYIRFNIFAEHEF
jgi:hypothetical protein